MNCLLTLYTAFLLILLFTSSNTQDCLKVFKSSNPKIGQLQTGHFQIMPSNPLSRYNWYRVQYQEQQIKGKVDVALSIIFINNYVDPTGTDFSIRPLVKDSYFDVVFTISVNAKWVKAHIHYIASSRDDLKCGTFTVNDNNLLQSTYDSQNRKITVSYSINNLNWSNANTKIIPYVFISGVKTEDLDFNLKLSQVDTIFASSTLYSTITISGNKKPIQTLYLSYFAYTMVGKVSVKSYPPNYNYLSIVINNQNNLTADDYGINGMTALIGANLQANLRANLANINKTGIGRLLEQNMGDKYSGVALNEIMIFKKAFEVEELDIVSNQFLEPILRSTMVPPVIQKLAQNNICINYDNCGENGGTVAILNQSSQACILCAPNKTFNYHTQQCECVPGMIASGDKCVSVSQFCGNNTIFVKGNCFQMIKTKDTCNLSNNEVFDNISQTCVCANGYKSVISNNKSTCVLNCVNGTVLNPITKLCQCPLGTHLKQKNCIKCNKNLQQWSEQKKQCVCKPPSAMTKKGDCLLCAANAFVNQQKNYCECLPGFIGNGVICRVQSPNGASSGITILNIQNTNNK